jgi:hypothetical protein
MSHDEENDCLFGEGGVGGDHLLIMAESLEPFGEGRHCLAGIGGWWCTTRQDEND